MSRLLLAHIVSSTEERDPMCEFGDYNYVPTSARSCNRRGPVTSVDGSSRSVVWFPVHGTALMLAVLQVIKYPSLCYLVQGRVIHHHQSIYFSEAGKGGQPGIGPQWQPWGHDFYFSLA